jgi:hypothetical protein
MHMLRHVVLVDTSETFAIQIRSGRAVLEARPVATGDAVAATTCAGLQAILSGDIGFQEAIKAGLLSMAGRWNPRDTRAR